MQRSAQLPETHRLNKSYSITFHVAMRYALARNHFPTHGFAPMQESPHTDILLHLRMRVQCPSTNASPSAHACVSTHACVSIYACMRLHLRIASSPTRALFLSHACAGDGMKNEKINKSFQSFSISHFRRASTGANRSL